MFTARHYRSQATVALELAQKSTVRRDRKGYTQLHIYWTRLALKAETREFDQQVPDTFAESMHHRAVRTYRRELAAAPPGLGRAKLMTLLARTKMAAQERGWPETAS